MPAGAAAMSYECERRMKRFGVPVLILVIFFHQDATAQSSQPCPPQFSPKMAKPTTSEFIVVGERSVILSGLAGWELLMGSNRTEAIDFDVVTKKFSHFSVNSIA